MTINPNTNATAVFVATRSGPAANLTTVYHDLAKGEAEKKGVTLYIKAEPDVYSLGYVTAAGNTTVLGTVANTWLQSYLPGFVLISLKYHSRLTENFVWLLAGKTMLGPILGSMRLEINCLCYKARYVYPIIAPEMT